MNQRPEKNELDHQKVARELTDPFWLVREIIENEVEKLPDQELVSCEIDIQMSDPSDDPRRSIDISLILEYHDSSRYVSQKRLLAFPIIVEDLDSKNPFGPLTEWIKGERSSFLELITPHLLPSS